jgi:hypothetical protein
MTDDQALKEYETALELFPTCWDAPERNADPGWWTRILDRETRAWQGLHTQNLLNSFKYFDVALSAHRAADVLRAARYEP